MSINGQWCNAQSGKIFALFYPSTGDEIARVPEADATDIDTAVRAACAAFKSNTVSL